MGRHSHDLDRQLPVLEVVFVKHIECEPASLPQLHRPNHIDFNDETSAGLRIFPDNVHKVSDLDAAAAVHEGEWPKDREDERRRLRGWRWGRVVNGIFTTLCCNI